MVSAYTQKHYTTRITTENGLPSNSINDIFKDSRGYIWIATNAGLSRYDGLNIITYTKNHGLPENKVVSITEDDSGNLWMGIYKQGISMFDGKKFTNYSEKDGLVNNSVRKVSYSKHHKGLLIGTNFGFSFYSDSTFLNFVDSTVTKRNLLQVTDFLETDSLVYLLTWYDNEQFI
jgi:ligand-binding sensor domain-containing protein